MNSTEFVYWLQGFFEISESKELNEKQAKIIKDHLNLVLTKVTEPTNQKTSKNWDGLISPTRDKICSHNKKYC